MLCLWVMRALSNVVDEHPLHQCPVRKIERERKEQDAKDQEPQAGRAGSLL